MIALKDKALVILTIIVVVMVCNVYAEPIVVKGKWGIPLSGAEVEIEKLDGTIIRGVLDENGQIEVKDVPLGIVFLRILSWKSVPMNFSVMVTYMNSTVVCDKIGKLRIKVVGVAGQGIGGAEINILYNSKIVETGVSNEAGVYETYLPEGYYNIVVKYSGKEQSKDVIVSPRVVNDVEVKFNVFIIIATIALSLEEFILLVIGIFALVVIIALIIYEYHLWRRRRLIRGLTTVKER